MGTPITWRNVDSGGQPALAIRPLESATTTFNGAFDAFGKVIQQREAFEAGQVARADDVVKQTYLDRLSAAKTPEELAALQASGALSTDGMATHVKAALRGAADARLTSVRQGVTAEQAYNAGQADIKLAPLKDQIVSASSLGTAEGFAKARELASQIPEGLGRAAMLNGVAVAERGLFERARSDRASADAETLRVATLKETQRVAAEAERQRGLDATIKDFSTNHQSTSLAMKRAAEAGVASFPGAENLPRNSDGTLAVERLTGTPVFAALNKHLNDQGLPTLDSIQGGDTKAKATLQNVLRDAGATPVDLAKLEPVLNSALSTSAPAPIGQEADTAARQLRGLQAEESAVNDQFGTVTNQGQAGALMKAGKEVINELTNPMTGGRERYNTALSRWLGKGGIPVKFQEKGADGKMTERVERVLPSEDQLRRVLGQVQTGWFRNTEADVGDLLEAWAKGTEAQDGARRVITIRDRNRLLGIDPIGKK